uniref:PBP domain-containing protein n=1 Tax=Aplanochytrium stocchinoi TaxID=215587 RepID=A0A6S8DPF8_9STRA|mmetsp:Transcript_20174/g.25777  ORF Transcript_20174/g.25777 Transcript_20174/m.25777 type:complete len:822 (+) Transcript_20174:150-2615(+)|eukprot:CAMPEP_0204872634 /NCGR_PEP_ID=MMETSP1348-20121228/38426_1 /ASSEMBLY_ACC=CAM_ASM_000700 /TAXON_ID=215587 /ORGANISM="Aplanochytrium stocchinoi, Strain GSBS06" /LENGTH=821 /DNA_ID=CAMNT_0052027539 /DNA_START=50 /DNA_END=2515 /DNA_ORIENTATION=-
MLRLIVAFCSFLVCSGHGNTDDLPTALEHEYLVDESLGDAVDNGIFGTAAIVIGHSILHFGGCSQPGAVPLSEYNVTCAEVSNKIYSFNSDVNSLQLVGTLPRARYRHAAALLNNKVYLFGGVDQNMQPVQVVDVVDIETMQADVEIPATLQIVDGTAFTVGEKVFFTGGFSLNDALKARSETIFIENGELRENGPSLKMARGAVGSIAVEEFAYVIGGRTIFNGDPLRTVEVFNGVDEEFVVSSAEMNVGRASAATAFLNGRIYAFGGESFSKSSHTLEILMLAEQRWTHGGEIEDPKLLPTAAGVQEHQTVYLFGGLSPDSFQPVSTFDRFIERSDLFSQPALHLHGAGTSNPSHFYWETIDWFKTASRLPLSMSYRSVGSGTGQAEFIGNNNTLFLPVNHFGSGDIPLTQEDYDAVTKHGHKVAHIPIGYGAVGIYVNLPELHGNERKIILDPCEIAEIFTGKITKWNQVGMHTDAFKQIDKDILPVHRTKSSSSTESVTTYLNAACGNIWGDEYVDSVLDPWPCGSNCEAAVGSGGVQSYIEGNPYSIGYLSVGHGYPITVQPALLFHNGKAIEATESGIQQASKTIWPPSAFDSFANISIINSKEDGAWPMTLVTYIYVRQDLTSLGGSAALLKAFLEYVLDESLGQSRIQAYQYVKLTPEVRALAMSGVEALTMPEGKSFFFEKSTMEIIGASPYALSKQRKSYANDKYNRLENSILGVQEVCSQKCAELESYDGEELRDEIEAVRAIAIAALVLALLSIAVNIVLGFILFKITKAVKHAKPVNRYSKGSRLDNDDADALEMSQSSNGTKQIELN